MSYHDEPPLVRAFREFHEGNPHVYELFCRFSFAASRKGLHRFSARMVWHRMRWYAAFETTDQTFKLNDHHTPYYARMFMEDHPGYEGFFELRRVAS